MALVARGTIRCAARTRSRWRARASC
jgi:hypothetical protein